MNTAEENTKVANEKSDDATLFKESFRALASADYFEEVICDGDFDQLSSLQEKNGSDHNNNSSEFSSIQVHSYLGIFEENTAADIENSDAPTLSKERFRALANENYCEEAICDGESMLTDLRGLSNLMENTASGGSNHNNNGSEFSSIQVYSNLGSFEENTTAAAVEKSDVSTLFKESFRALANADYCEEAICDGETMLTDFRRLSSFMENTASNCSDNSNNGFEFSSIDAISSRRYETNGDFVLPDDVVMLDETSSNEIMEAMNKSHCGVYF
jgi:hypothetical protein